jgi:hypothetical protein
MAEFCLDFAVRAGWRRPRVAGTNPVMHQAAAERTLWRDLLLMRI